MSFFRITGLFYKSCWSYGRENYFKLEADFQQHKYNFQIHHTDAIKYEMKCTYVLKLLHGVLLENNSLSILFFY